MKKIILFSLLILSSLWLSAQEKNYSNKVATIDSTIKTLYAVISGEKGEARDWELFTFLFHKDAKLIPTGKNKQGKSGAVFMSPKDYIKTNEKWLVDNGFYEKEIGRKTEVFGNIAHVFSTYESFRSKFETKPFMRGINSIQLLNDGTRWWILNVYWQAENNTNPIPKKYINKN